MTKWGVSHVAALYRPLAPCALAAAEIAFCRLEGERGAMFGQCSLENDDDDDVVDGQQVTGYTDSKSGGCMQAESPSNTQSSKDNCAAKGAQQQEANKQGALGREHSAFSSHTCKQAVCTSSTGVSAP